MLRRSRRTEAKNSRCRLVYRLEKTDALVALLEDKNNQLEEDLRESMDREEEGAMRPSLPDVVTKPRQRHHGAPV